MTYCCRSYRAVGGPCGHPAFKGGYHAQMGLRCKFRSFSDCISTILEQPGTRHQMHYWVSPPILVQGQFASRRLPQRTEAIYAWVVCRLVASILLPEGSHNPPIHLRFLSEWYMEPCKEYLIAILSLGILLSSEMCLCQSQAPDSQTTCREERRDPGLLLLDGLCSFSRRSPSSQ